MAFQVPCVPQLQYFGGGQTQGHHDEVNDRSNHKDWSLGFWLLGANLLECSKNGHVLWY